jgi:hypothetical protein
MSEPAARLAVWTPWAKHDNKVRLEFNSAEKGRHMNEQSGSEHAAYRTTMPQGAAAGPQSIPSYRLFDSTSVALATFLGSPVAGASLMALNYRRMGKGSSATVVFILCLGVTGLAIGFGYLIPPYATTVVAVALVVSMKNAAKALQGPAVEAHICEGRALGSRWVATGLGIAYLALLFGGVLLFESVHETSSKIVVGSNDDIYYSGSATKEDATTLGEALKKVGYFHNQAASVLLSKGTDGQIVSFVVKDGIWKRPEIVAAFEEIGREIAPTVGGFPIKLRLVNTSRETLKELIVGKVIIGSKDEIYYLGGSTEAIAMALGRSFKSAGYFEDRGVSVFLSKGDDGTTVSFVLAEGSWENAENVAVFEGLVRQGASIIGGLPIKLHLVNSSLEIKREKIVN